MCGWVVLLGGSSPLTRGKPRAPIRGRRIIRLIPAHAGKTHSLAWFFRAYAAHPRSRGENREPYTKEHHVTGSSPLTRGKLLSLTKICGLRRLIPAHAGKTFVGVDEGGGGGAHPRSRGENGTRIDCDMTRRGSSPLTRGKPRRRARCRSGGRLIPAHAGKTSTVTRLLASRAAHPRSRGENTGSCGPPQVPRGSSPLTRGKRQARRDTHRHAGLIPAHAGKTHTRSRGRARGAAHPRSRGENPWTVCPKSDAAGSSPLTRGKRAHAVGWGWRVGLIPAHAGKTRDHGTRNDQRAAHPRSRGENTIQEKK